MFCCVKLCAHYPFAILNHGSISVFLFSELGFFCFSFFVKLSMFNKFKNRGLAFVTMGSEEEALAALENLDSYVRILDRKFVGVS